jgi:hypothetical protein
MEYEFTLKYQLGEQDSDVDEVMERLGAGGCDDALIGIGQTGRVGLKFTREARSAREALISAMADVRAALPSAKLIEAGPDFVGLTDVAQIVRMTRQNLRKLMTTHAANFPIPVHDGNSGVWHLADLLGWLQTKGSYLLPQGMVEVSLEAKRVNQVKEAIQISQEDKQEMEELVA